MIEATMLENIISLNKTIESGIKPKKKFATGCDPSVSAQPNRMKESVAYESTPNKFGLIHKPIVARKIKVIKQINLIEAGCSKILPIDLKSKLPTPNKFIFCFLFQDPFLFLLPCLLANTLILSQLLSRLLERRCILGLFREIVQQLEALLQTLDFCPYQFPLKYKIPINAPIIPHGKTRHSQIKDPMIAPITNNKAGNTGSFISIPTISISP
jgi:hypothetical protein